MKRIKILVVCLYSVKSDTLHHPYILVVDALEGALELIESGPSGEFQDQITIAILSNFTSPSIDPRRIDTIVDRLNELEIKLMLM